MKVLLGPFRKSVRLKVKKYPVEHRTFLNAYFSTFVEMGFLKVHLQAAWQAAPHSVPKISKAKLKMTIDLTPVCTATEVERRPMPVMDAMLREFNRCAHFASIDFCSSYWKCPLDPSSTEARDIIAPQQTTVSPRVFHGLNNASAYFQSTILPLLDDIKHAIKAPINDFTLYLKSGKELLYILGKFITTCIAYSLRISA